MVSRPVSERPGYTPELQGKEISPDSFRTDLPEAAVANLSDMDTDGAGYERRTIELRENGE